ncbi:uncharacterized protein LOC113521061 [Galleria mellonella]|uniref:Uncharacterized protein LOC113521061 n=1 Tax=Galleria mellonella TaxID=7137 RepID=A0A6J1X798_GALME|nr:uncharacterized protein LOC113521061 [Galleria mellonella]
MSYALLVVVLSVVGCLSAPADEPIRVDLPVYDQPQESSNIYTNQQGAISSDTSLSELLSHRINSGVNTAKAGSLNIQGADGWFAPPITTLEGALLETEGLGSKTLSVKENLQHIVAGILQPKPLVDTIEEEEKYGNTGDKFYGTGRAIVKGAEGVSNFVNSIIEVPGTIIRKITKAASDKLNNLGGRLIGL